MHDPQEPAPDLKAVARSIFARALEDCRIEHALDEILPPCSAPAVSRIVIACETGPVTLEIEHLKRLRVVAIGKAGASMLSAVPARLPLPASCQTEAILIAPDPPRNLAVQARYYPGGHPLPNQASFDGAAAALAMLRSIADFPAEETLCLFLISGGGSASMELPLDAAISLEDTRTFHRELVHCGASIAEINCVRKHFSAVKGGRLALAAGHAQKLSLLVSDVPPAHLDALASGPTLPGASNEEDCREILARYNLMPRFPTAVQDFFAATPLPECPRPGELDSPYYTLLDSDQLALAAQTHAQALGFHAVIDNACDDWPYDRAADYLLDRLRELRRHGPRVCLISTGEVTVRVPLAGSATGGRNQHFALYAATRFRPIDGPIALLSAGSDGIDGNSPAAGAVVDGLTIDTAAKLASAQQSLQLFDSFGWLDQAGATLMTGPTGQNLRDLRILLLP